MSATHRYRSQLWWKGSTGDGYETYDRSHRVSVPPAPGELVLSAGPEFGGTEQLPNPEQLLVAAASSCQLLTFLAFAAGSGVDVLAYEDEATGVMPEDDEPVRITQITLSPRILAAPDTDVDRLERLVQRAHERCFIANSTNTPITVQPSIELAATPRVSGEEVPAESRGPAHRTASENKRILQKAFIGLEKGDGAAFSALMAEDFTWTIAGVATSWAGSYRGKRAVRDRLLAPLFRQFADPLANTAVSFIAEGDRVVVECRGRALTKDGNRYDNHYCWVCRFDDDGRLVELVEYADTALMEAVLSPPPAGGEPVDSALP